jgi:hypothetical protein
MSDVEREAEITRLERRKFKICDGCGKEVLLAVNEYSAPDWFRVGFRTGVLDACSDKCAMAAIQKLAAVAI